nr:reverse transcriptase domain-containing protein [Tanacetum cinerariifolium]
MSDNRTVEEIIQAPTEGYGDAIVVPDTENFEIKTGLLSLIQANQFYGFESNNLHDHIRSFNRITSILKFRDVPNDAIKLMLFPYSLEGAAKICGNSSSTDARIDKLTDTISNLVETFNKKMTTPATVKAVEETCVICGGAHPYYDCIATDSNILSVCSTTGTYNQGNTGFCPQVATNYRANQISPPGTRDFQAYMKANDAVMKNMQTQMTSLTNSNIELRNMFGKFIKMNTASSLGLGSLPSNTVPNPREDLKAITTRSGVTLVGPTVSPPYLPSKEPSPASTSSTPISSPKMPEVTKDTVQPSTKNIQPSMVQNQVPIDDPVVAPKPKPTIPYLNLHFELSFADALLHIPKFALMFKNLLNKKEKLFDLATTPVNENYSMVILKKLLEKLGDPGKFLIPCDFPELDECLALADLGASINLMPLSIWRKLSLPELTSTQMILELADRSMTRPAGIAEDVFVKVGKFHFPTDFVVVDYVINPRVPLILGRPFLRTSQALIDVYGEEFTPRVDDEAITFKEYVQEVLGFYDNPKSGSPTPTLVPIISFSSPSFTHFEGSDFILEEIETFLRTLDEISNLDDDYYDTKGDILYLEKLLNEDLSSNLPSFETDDLKQVDATMTKPSIKEPPELELKESPSHLEYAFLKRTNKLPVIISKELRDEEKSALLKILKSHKWAITWKSSILRIPIDLQDQEKTTFTCPYETFAYRRMPFGLCNAPGTFQRCMMAIFHDMIEKMMETIVYTDHSALKYLLAKQDAKPRFLRWILLLQEFNVINRDKKGAENLAADHLPRLENPHQDELEKKEITETFPLETLGIIAFRGDSSTPWFADIANYHVGNFIVKGMSS